MSGRNSKKIGLLGGSFNPAHEGHIYISMQALEILGLDEIWWLVSPQNPLKPTSGMADFALRIKSAQKISATYPKIIISDFEAVAGTVYTYDTIIALKKEFNQHNFVWLMGADNVLQFPKWYKWKDIAATVPIAIFNRDDLKCDVISSQFATEFCNATCIDARHLALVAPPSWIFLDIKTNPASSTKIRGE